eukprot:m.95111 g.95111  ORF g.95111 m.95111 type:complete len:118 (+) comp14753_c0_seq3:163-516(+)
MCATGRQMKVLAPCLHNLPETLTDVGLQLSDRPLHMLVNPELKQNMLVRSKVLQALRAYLLARDFVEVETPILGAQAGGANARPFWTKANAVDRMYALRIAPELYLKVDREGGFFLL